MIHRVASRFLSPLLVLALLGQSRLGRADGNADDKVLATVLFRDGRALMAEGRLSEACPKLEESNRLDPSGGTILNLALCHQQQGMLASSWSEFNEAAAFARRDLRPDRETVARKYALALERRLSRLTIVVPARARMKGLRIERDGRDLGDASWSTAMPIDGGEHVVRASAPGMEPFAGTVVLANEGDAQTIEIPPLTTAAAVAPPRAKTPLTAAPFAAPTVLNSNVGSPSEKRRLRRTLAWTIGAVGIAQLGIAGYFGLHAVDEHRRSNDLCPGGQQCTSQLGVDLNNDAGRAADASTVLTVTGLVGVAVGVYLLVTSHETSTAIAARPNLLVTISANESMVALRSRF
jgi:hypothetical protein